jgi:hypothetical protein
MRAYDQNTQTAREGAEKSLFREIEPLAIQLCALWKTAKKHGVFLEDRELLHCKKCGLKEDVAFDGRLMVCRTIDPLHKNTGLVFKEIGQDRFRCPGCGRIMKVIPFV